MTLGTNENDIDVDALRKKISLSRDDGYKSEFGQFLTPQTIANLMASFFSEPTSSIRLLDPGCGHGALSYAFANRFKNIPLDIEGWEVDLSLHAQFTSVIQSSDNNLIQSKIHGTDFVKDGVIRHLTKRELQFTHVILNPPYKKISAVSETRQSLKEVKIQSVNLYTAFLALSVLLTQKSGEIVSITPRSFFNGSY